MKKIMILMGLFASNAFALSLGDTVEPSKMTPNPSFDTTMKFSAKSDHTEYTISKATGTSVALVNKNNKVYGFSWKDSAPDIEDMLGTTYKSEFDAAYAKRPIGDHRSLMINTDHVSVSQFGLPGGPFTGSMTAKDLAPSN